MKYVYLPYEILALAAALLFIAIAPLPYGYYTFMRIIVCGCAGVICYRLWNSGYQGVWLWVWAMVAILFNPVATIHMTKEIWMTLDAITGVFFAYSAYLQYKTRKGDGHE
ncbi:MAG: hypothetical protein LRZ85_08515 [Alphaproteobacteria bacterium]|nr:hypothetical protein [Alphaproteobacteria bacterium]